MDPSIKNYISGIGYIDSDQQNVKIIKADFFASNFYQIGDEGYFAGMKNEETEFWKVKLCPFSLNLNTSLGVINETTSITVHTHITVTAKAPLTSNNNLSAGNSILLMPGFETTENSFKADIKGCKY